jgi:hypothetical protein
MNKLLFLMPLVLLVIGCFPGLPAATTPGSAPVIVAFTANPTGLAPGQSATLIWNVTNATSIQIDQGVGSGLAAAGTVSVTPGASTTYNLVASNSAGTVSSSLTISVSSSPSPSLSPSPSPPPPFPPLSSPGFPPNIVTFDISPNVINIPPGPGPRNATMRWEVRNAASVTIDGSPVALSGSRILTPPAGTHTFVIRAVNPQGTDTRTQVLRVVP